LRTWTQRCRHTVGQVRDNRVTGKQVCALSFWTEVELNKCVAISGFLDSNVETDEPLHAFFARMDVSASIRFPVGVLVGEAQAGGDAAGLRVCGGDMPTVAEII